VATADGDSTAAWDHALRSSLGRSGKGTALRLRHATPEGGSRSDGRALGTAEVLVALALLALNDREHAKSLLGTDDPGGASLALVASAWAAWTGQAEPLTGAWPRVAAWLDDAGSGASDATARAALALAPAAAELMGDGTRGARLRAARLERPAEALVAVANDGVRAGEESERAVSAAQDVLRTIHGTLGIEPDAPRGRIRLAPRLDGTEVRLSDLAVGDALLALRARMEEPRRAVIDIEQTSGPSPFTLVVEPWLSAGSLIRASVDGTAADLTSSAEEGGLRARVQLVADHARRVVLEVE
jgi:hypothetical protein